MNLLATLALAFFLSPHFGVLVTVTAAVVYALFRVVDWLLP